MLKILIQTFRKFLLCLNPHQNRPNWVATMGKGTRRDP